ncbi:MAG: hypothetical protein ACFFAN_05805 [Promethearchaeota archaeon]
MGFKCVDIGELESSLSPSFLGLPLRQFEDVALLKERDREQKIKKLEKISNVILLSEEVLEYNYNKNENLENFTGTGQISILNNSKKNRIWDARLKFLKAQNIDLKNKDIIKLGNFEPETSKNINYTIIESKNLPKLVKIKEKIEVLNINTEKIHDVVSKIDEISTEPKVPKPEFEPEEKKEVKLEEIKDKKDVDLDSSIEEIIDVKKEKIPKSKKEKLFKRKDFVKKEIEDEFDPQIKSIESKLSAEQKNLDDLIKERNEWTVTRNQLNDIVKNLKNQHKSLLKIKSKALSKRLKLIPEEEKLEKTEKFFSTVNKLKSEISANENEIVYLEEEFEKEEINAKKEVENDFSPQMNDILSRLNSEQVNLDEAIENIEEFKSKKIKLNEKIKVLKKELKNLLKIKDKTLSRKIKETSRDEESSKKIEKEVEEEFGPKISGVESELNEDQVKLDKIIKEFKDWTAKKKELSTIIKNLKNEHGNLLKANSKALNVKIKERLKEKKIKLKEFRSQISAKKDEISKLEEKSSKKEDLVEKEVDNTYNPKIKGIESKINDEQRNLDESIQKIAELNIKKRELSETIKDLKNEHETLLKAKSNSLNMRLKEISEEEQKEIIGDLDISSKEKKTQSSLKDDQETKMDEEFSEKEESIKNDVEKEFDPQIRHVKSKLNDKMEKLDKTVKKADDWEVRRNELSEKIKNLKKHHKSLLKIKSKALKKRLNLILKEEKLQKTDESQVTAKELKSEISPKEDKIISVEEEFTKKEITAKKKVEEEFDPQIKDIKSKLEVEQKNLEETNANIRDFKAKKIKLSEKIKALKKELENILKIKSKTISKRIKETSRDEESSKEIENEVEQEFSSQISSVESKLKVEQENLDQYIESLNDLNDKEEELNTIVKDFKKEHENLLKAKSKALNVNLKKIFNEKKSKLKEIKSQKNLEENEMSQLKEKSSKKKALIEKEVQNAYDSKIKNIESKLSVEQENLEEAIAKNTKWTTKKKELNDIIKTLKKEYQTLLKLKSKALNTRLKENSEEIKKKKKLDSIPSLKEKALKKRERLMRTEFKETLEDTSEDKVTETIQDIESKQEDLVPEFDRLEIDVISSKTQDVESKIETEFKSEYLDNNYILLFNKLNSLKFTILFKNTTKSLIQNFRIIKILSEDFKNIKYESKSVSNIEINKGNIIISIKELKPDEEINLIIYADVKPTEKKIIGTGRIQISYIYKDYLISGTEFESFTAYSHVMHAIKIKEKETAPNMWNCSLIFKNNSDLDIELKSILVLDKEKKNKYIDLNFSSENNLKVVKPEERFVSKEWEIKDEFEPKFFRKLEYSVTHTIQSNTKVSLNFEEKLFEIVDLMTSKKLSETEIKSFEETKIENLINIKNIGTIPVKGFVMKEVIPADFLPPLNSSDLRIRTSTGKKNLGTIKFLISPNNDDPTIPHVLELRMNLDDINSNYLIGVNEFLEIRYFFNAISPSYKKNYEFPLEIKSFYPKENESPQNYYSIEKILSRDEQPQLKVIHRRRDLLISKEIFPGRNDDEFAISIIVTNNSNIEVKDIKIKDTISKSFELISTNIKYGISESEGKSAYIISFIIDNILPFQEKEIRYYLKNISGENIDYEELESFIFG